MQCRIILTNSHTCVRACSVTPSCLIFCDPFVCACQAPPLMGFPIQEHWSWLPFPAPGDLPNPGIEPASPASPVLAGRFLTTAPPGKPSPKQFCFKGNRAPKKIPATHKMSGVKCTRGSPNKNLIWGMSSCVFSLKNIILFVLLEKSKTNWDKCAPCPVELGYLGRKAQNKPHTEG